MEFVEKHENNLGRRSAPNNGSGIDSKNTFFWCTLVDKRGHNGGTNVLY